MNSQKKILPRRRLQQIEFMKNYAKTTVKILKPNKSDEDESEDEFGDFEKKLLVFPKFREKYGKNFLVKNNNNKIIVNSIINKYGGDYPYQRLRAIERKIEGAKKTNANASISEVDEELYKKHNNRRNERSISQIRPKGKYNLIMNKKAKEILGNSRYSRLLDDPLNPYGTFWPSVFLKAGYDVGFEYDDFQSGVPLLKLKYLGGKKQLPPIKKKLLHFNDSNNIFSPNKKGATCQYPGSSSKKNFKEDIWDISRVNKSDNIKLFNTKH